MVASARCQGPEVIGWYLIPGLTGFWAADRGCACIRVHICGCSYRYVVRSGNSGKIIVDVVVVAKIAVVAVPLGARQSGETVSCRRCSGCAEDDISVWLARYPNLRQWGWHWVLI